MPTSDKAQRIRASFDALPSRARRQRAAPRPPLSATERMFPSLRVSAKEQERADNVRRHLSPLGGRVKGGVW